MKHIQYYYRDKTIDLFVEGDLHDELLVLNEIDRKNIFNDMCRIQSACKNSGRALGVCNLCISWKSLQEGRIHFDAIALCPQGVSGSVMKKANCSFILSELARASSLELAHIVINRVISHGESFNSIETNHKIDRGIF